MPVGTTLDRLVEEFVATLQQHGYAVDRPTVQQEAAGRIADIAERLGIAPQAVLREHARDGWGRAMAEAVITQINAQQLLTPAGSVPAARATARRIG